MFIEKGYNKTMEHKTGSMLDYIVGEFISERNG